MILPQDSPGHQGKYYLSLTSTEIEEDVERNMYLIMQRWMLLGPKLTCLGNLQRQKIRFQNFKIVQSISDGMWIHIINWSISVLLTSYFYINIFKRVKEWAQEREKNIANIQKSKKRRTYESSIWSSWTDLKRAPFELHTSTLKPQVSQCNLSVYSWGCGTIWGSRND